MEFNLLNMKVSVKRKEEKNKIKAEYKYTEYGNNFYDIILDGDIVERNVLEMDIPDIMDKYQRKYNIRFLSW